MNIKMILQMLGNIFVVEALLLLPSVGIALYDGDTEVVWALLFTVGLLVVLALAIRLACRRASHAFYAREGFLLVAITWVAASAFGALPFYLSGEIPSYVEAYFEIVSGFTTTGASILVNVEELSRALLYWRSFTHWLGGMGILVFVMAVIPAARGRGESLYVLRAESPGPSVEKMVPKTRQHAMILYGIYIGMTILCFCFLLAGKMPLFDSLCITFGTAGTGGFGIKVDSMNSYSPYLQNVVTVFMALFGVNFNIFYLLMARRFRDAWRDEELRAYVGIMLLAIGVISVNIFRQFDTFRDAIHHAAFSVSSVMTTTGYTTVDFDAWPELSRSILLVLMIFGASAGSTGGGVKISRLLLLFKAVRREIQRMLHPRSVNLVRMNGRMVDEKVLRGIYVYMVTYAAILLLSFLIVSADNFSLDTSLSAVLSCLNNIGPGLGGVGPTGNYEGFSVLSKIVLTADMLLGRLEIFPVLILFSARSWNRAA